MRTIEILSKSTYTIRNPGIIMLKSLKEINVLEFKSIDGGKIDDLQIDKGSINSQNNFIIIDNRNILYVSYNSSPQQTIRKQSSHSQIIIQSVFWNKTLLSRTYDKNIIEPVSVCQLKISTVFWSA